MRWKIGPFSRVDKRIHIEGPDEMHLEVDFDDVNHDAVEPAALALTEVLNATGYTLVRMEDWEALYDPDGQMVIEGHSIDHHELLHIVSPGTAVHRLPDDIDAQIAESGYVPHTLQALRELGWKG